jgi:predicted amidohydrolase
MARWITVSCLSSSAWDGDGQPQSDVVASVIAGWADRLGSVLPDQPDIIVLSEACDDIDTRTMRENDAERGAEMLAYYALRGDRVREFFARVARDNHCYIAYAAIRQAADGTWRNSIQLLDRAGEIAGVYDKNHVVISENEDLDIQYSDEVNVFDLDFGRVGCAICYDLNFDELQARYVQARLDLLLFSSMFHGSFLQRQWAYSSRAYLAAAIRPPARCAVVSPVGEIVAQSTNYFNELTHRINLDRVVAHLDGNGTALSAMKRKYGRAVQIHDPGLLGSVLVTSESDEVSAGKMAEEFGLELLDTYFRRARDHRAGRLLAHPPDLEPTAGLRR